MQAYIAKVTSVFMREANVCNRLCSPYWVPESKFCDVYVMYPINLCILFSQDPNEK